MIVVIKLISGEEIIGVVECTEEEFTGLTQLELVYPMWIVPGEHGTMKLRDAMMLAVNESLIFAPEGIITCYKPSQSLTQYYLRAHEYSKKYTRANINTQIDEATNELVMMMREEEEYASKVKSMLRKVTGSKLH